ncbi:hypothetical protein [Acinetobacter sp.]|uniref:hypothetical protein n=1 Tax=Acinetobacter sp. TaxID=472 RepID=UPI002FDA098B
MNQIVTMPYPLNTYSSCGPQTHGGTASPMNAELPTLLSKPPLNLSLRYDDAEFQKLAVEATNILRKIERGQVNVYSNPIKGIFDSQFVRLMCILPEFVQFVPQLQTYRFNPYLSVVINESINYQHPWNRVGNHLPNYHYYFSAVHTRLVGELIKCKAGLNYQGWTNWLKESQREQHKIFDRLVKRHSQVNCMFMEVPYVKNTGLQLNATEETIERQFVRLIEHFCIVSRESRQFSSKLANIQWRIVKGLDQILSAHLLIYIIGEANDYLPLIRMIWENICSERCLTIGPLVNCPLKLHTYINNGVMNKKWLTAIKCYQSPLEFYRYKANGVNFEWKHFLGNVS